MDAGTWTIDPDATKVGIEVKNMKFMTVPATFAVLSGAIRVDAAGEPNVRASVAANSFHTGMGPRDKHVVSKDFLNANEHPEITFTSSEAKRNGEDYVLKGTLTVAGNSGPMTMDVTDIAFKGAQATFTAEAAIERAAFGVHKMPNFMIGPTVVVKITGTASRDTEQQV